MNELNKEHIPYLIIDGHSIIFAWKNLRALHDNSQLKITIPVIDKIVNVLVLASVGVSENIGINIENVNIAPLR